MESQNLPNAQTFEEFNSILKQKLEQVNLPTIHIKYEMPSEPSWFDEWMKSNLDRFGIARIVYKYRKGGELKFKILSACESF